MPYIKQTQRSELNPKIDELYEILEKFDHNKGCYNYIITKLLHIYIAKMGLKYETLNDVTGIIESVKIELNRRITGPYEEKKCKLNGDIGIIHI